MLSIRSGADRKRINMFRKEFHNIQSSRFDFEFLFFFLIFNLKFNLNFQVFTRVAPDSINRLLFYNITQI